MHCEHCGKPFIPLATWQKFCSANCRSKSWNASKRDQRGETGGGGGQPPINPPPVSGDFETAVFRFIRKQGTSSLEALSNKFDVSVLRIRTVLESLKTQGFNIKVDNNLSSAAVANDLSIEGGHSRIDTTKFKGTAFRFGFTADNHLCSKYARNDVLNALYDIWEADGITQVYQGGNMIDGEARFNRYDLLTRPGIDAQAEYLMNEWPSRKSISTHFVTGDDHEGWYVQREGIDISAYLNHAAKKAGRGDMEFLSYMEHTIDLEAKNGKSSMRIIHAGGGSAYATSYTVQKIVESYQPNEKPTILLVGHFHKAEFSYPRAVLAVQAGCTQDQTPFLRKKRIEAMIGGWTIEFTLDDNGIVHNFKTTWHPFYDRSFYSRWNYIWRPKN